MLNGHLQRVSINECRMAIQKYRAEAITMPGGVNIIPASDQAIGVITIGEDDHVGRVKDPVHPHVAQVDVETVVTLPTMCANRLFPAV